MTRLPRHSLLGLACLSFCITGTALEREDVEFPIYQFPADAIPRIDGNTEDWEQVPSRYVVGTDQLWEDSGKHEGLLPESIDVSVKVAWVEGSNRLYFLYEAYDDYWDFELPGLKNDTFEIVVDADLSGETLIDRFRRNESVVGEGRAWESMHGAHAQNYHIFTPAKDKDWAMYWGPAQWLKSLPYANYAYNYDFSPGESGRLVLEFWITPFDHADPRGAEYSSPSELREGDLIGLCWAIIDYDDVDSDRNNGFWNLSRSHTMYGKAAELVPFRLMPLEPENRVSLSAKWTCQTVDRAARSVLFKAASNSGAVSWNWDFGDGNHSEEMNPIHQYEKAGHYVVVLEVTGEEGETAQFSRVWDVSFKD